MLVFLDGLVKDQNEAGENQDDAGNANHDTLCHDDAHIAAHRKAHCAEGQETGNRGERAARKRDKGRRDGICHGFLLV